MGAALTILLVFGTLVAATTIIVLASLRFTQRVLQPPQTIHKWSERKRVLIAGIAQGEKDIADGYAFAGTNKINTCTARLRELEQEEDRELRREAQTTR